jgi:hypothetical protein
VGLHGDQVRARAATTNPHRYGGMDKTVAVSGNGS